MVLRHAPSSVVGVLVYRIVAADALAQVHRVALSVGGVEVGEEGGPTGHCLIPSLGRYRHLGPRVDEDRLRIVVPGATQPHLSLRRDARSGDGGVSEHISPPGGGGMLRCHDESPLFAVDEQGAVVEIGISRAVDEIDSPLYCAVFDVVASVVGIGGAVGVLIAP